MSTFDEPVIIQLVDGEPTTITLAGGGGGGTPQPTPITVAPVEVPGVGFYYDLSTAAFGDVFDLTATPTTGSPVLAAIVPPPPDAARFFTVNWHVSTDSTTFVGMFSPGLANAPGGYPTNQFRPFTGAVDAKVQVQSAGNGSYVLAPLVDGEPALNLTMTDASKLLHDGAGLLGGLFTVGQEIDALEGLLDRWRWVSGVSVDPAFDPTPFVGAGNGPVTGLDYGASVPTGNIACLARTDPTLPYIFDVASDGSLTAINNPDVVNPPGNGYTVYLSKPGDANDGRFWRWSSNDPHLVQRGGAHLVVTDPTGRWLTYSPVRTERVLATDGSDGSAASGGVLTVGYSALAWLNTAPLPSGDTVLDFANPGAGKFAIFDLLLRQNAAGDATVSGLDALTSVALHSTTWNVQVHGTASGPPDVISYRSIIDQI